MNAVTFDTHAAVQELRAANLTEQQAEALVRVFSHAIGEPATKADLDVAVNSVNARTDARLAELETRLIKWMVGIAITLAGVMIAAGTAFVVAILRTVG